MKKILILICTILFFTLNAQADYNDVINGINKTLDTIDYTETTINKIQNTVPNRDNNKRYNYNKTQTQTINYDNSYQSSYPSRNYNYNKNPEYQNNTEYPAIRNNYQEPEVQYNTNNFNQNRNYTGNATTLKELPVGTIVMDVNSVWNYRRHQNYTGDIQASYPVFWKKLEDNHFANNATLLLSVPTIAYYPFCHGNKGLRAWDESDVRRFLRTTFYNHLSSGFKNAIVEVNIPFADMAGNPKTVRDNFFILSIVEWVLSDRANNGTAIKYDDLPKIYGAFSTISYDSNRNSYHMSPNFERNWTRTINRPAAISAGFPEDVFVISNKGILETKPSRYAMTVVRPAVNLKSSTKVKGPYEFIYNSNQDRLIYYVLDFGENTPLNNQ